MRLTWMFLCLIPAVLVFAHAAHAQRPVALRDSVPQYIFSFQEIEFPDDPARSLTIADVPQRIRREIYSESHVESLELQQMLCLLHH